MAHEPYFDVPLRPSHVKPHIGTYFDFFGFFFFQQTIVMYVWYANSQCERTESLPRIFFACLPG